MDRTGRGTAKRRKDEWRPRYAIWHLFPLFASTPKHGTMIALYLRNLAPSIRGAIDDWRR
jgi:hypothetical protein